MAIQTPKSKDATALALSAVEEALKLDLDAGSQAQAPVPGGETAAASATPADTTQLMSSAIERALMGEAGEAAAVETTAAPAPRVADPAPARRGGGGGGRDGGKGGLQRMAANDDRLTARGLALSVDRPSSKAPIYVATGAALGWAGVGAGLIHFGYSDTLTAVGTIAELLRVPGFLSSVLAAALPVPVITGVGFLIWRLQELRNASRSLTDAALRLSEPAGGAVGDVAMVGQAIRREVAAMGDGVDRAIARAGELEILVRREVSALERSYTDNENRIRSLIDELVT